MILGLLYDKMFFCFILRLVNDDSSQFIRWKRETDAKIAMEVP